jgi:hypothetical protein
LSTLPTRAICQLSAVLVAKLLTAVELVVCFSATKCPGSTFRPPADFGLPVAGAGGVSTGASGWAIGSGVVTGLAAAFSFST